MTRRTQRTHTTRSIGRVRRVAIIAIAATAAGTLISLARSAEPIHPHSFGPRTASALAPEAQLCASNSAFCGAVLRIESSTGIMGSVAAGAHYGSAWGIPTASNDSRGTGWCVDDTHTGFPVGPISEQPLPTEWTPDDQRVAATIISLFGGDRVLPYQPLEVDADGELVGSSAGGATSTRLRHVAVWLALRSVLLDPAGTPRIDLTTASTFTDTAGRTPSATGNAAIPLARRMVEVARRATPRGGAPLVTIALTSDQRSSGPDTVVDVPVRVTDPTGRPMANVPVWPHGITNVAATAHASDDRASLQANSNAVLAGWPSFDTTSARSGATVTDMNGVAHFSLQVLTPAAWSASFSTETAPTRLQLFGDDVRAQNNVALRGGMPTVATAVVDGDATQRHIRVVKTTTDATRSVAGATFALLDADDTEVDRGRTGGDGIVDFIVDAGHRAPLRVREVEAPPGLVRLDGDVDATAHDGVVSTDPARPTIVTVENRPLLHEVSITKRVVSAPAVPDDLSGFTFTITHTADLDAARIATVVTDIDGRTPVVELAAGDYDIVEVARPEWWPGDDPLPPPRTLSIPIENHGDIIVTIDNVFPEPVVTTTPPTTPQTATTVPATTTEPSAPTPATAAPPTTTPTTTTETTTTTTTSTTVLTPASTAPAPATRPPATPERALPRTGGEPWQIWYRVGSWIVLAGAGLFFTSTVGLARSFGSGGERGREGRSASRTKRETATPRTARPRTTRPSRSPS